MVWINNHVAGVPAAHDGAGITTDSIVCIPHPIGIADRAVHGAGVTTATLPPLETERLFPIAELSLRILGRRATSRTRGLWVSRDGLRALRGLSGAWLTSECEFRDWLRRRTAKAVVA